MVISQRPMRRPSAETVQRRPGAAGTGAERRKDHAHLSARRRGAALSHRRARFRDRVLLQWAGAPQGAGAIQWRMLLEMADSWQRPRFPLTGRDVMLAGVPEGPDVGRVLAQVEDWWVGGDFAADEGACRDQLQSVIAGTAHETGIAGFTVAARRSRQAQ